jgi:hypothetical protein
VPLLANTTILSRSMNFPVFRWPGSVNVRLCDWDARLLEKYWRGSQLLSNLDQNRSLTDQQSLQAIRQSQYYPYREGKHTLLC